jgi:hypothetical protein
MAHCAFCKSETELYENGTPICVHCAEAREAGSVPRLGSDHSPPGVELKIREILRQEVLETTATLKELSEEFNALLNAIPSGVPYPDGTHRIQLASRTLSAARKDMIRAHSRLNDFLSRGVVPEELKQSAGDHA